MISPSSIQQIVSRINVLEVIGEFVKLKKRGANYLGLCPFHHEKSPSFTVSPAKEIFKCFGCGKSGNSISFLMEHEKINYVESLRWLAKKYNIDLEETQASPEVIQKQQLSESLFIINSFAQKFYASNLFDTEEGRAVGLTYMLQRGFSENTLQKFGVGYALDSRTSFSSAALAQQFNPELLQKAGLVVERNEQLADNYRDRIIFPIHNPTGKIIGFGARLIKKNDKAPKYINTPENELYLKSKILYGIYFSRHAIDRADECLLVEGYTDVVSLHQSGIENVVASGGTSLTQDQLRLIKKYTKNLTIIYDGDAAGIKAALRGLDMALEERLNVKLVLIPGGEDPDSYVQKIGSDAFQKFVADNKKDFLLFLLEVSLKDAGSDANKKSEVVNTVAETIAKIDRTEDFTKQQEYIRQCAQILHIDEGGFTALVNKFIRNRVSLVENKLPFDEAKYHEENARKGAATEFDDQTYNLLFKDDLQEREIARVLLEHGTKAWNETQRIDEFILAELPEEDLIENAAVKKLIHIYKEESSKSDTVDKNFFIYNEDQVLSTLVVALLYFPYELSYRWKKDIGQSTGYQNNLFQQDYKSFLKTISRGNEDHLSNYLKTQEDKTINEVELALNQIKLRKIKRLLLENIADMEHDDPKNNPSLWLTHQHLKNLEMELSKKIGSVIIK